MTLPEDICNRFNSPIEEKFYSLYLLRSLEEREVCLKICRNFELSGFRYCGIVQRLQHKTRTKNALEKRKNGTKNKLNKRNDRCSPVIKTACTVQAVPRSCRHPKRGFSSPENLDCPSCTVSIKYGLYMHDAC